MNLNTAVAATDHSHSTASSSTEGRPFYEHARDEFPLTTARPTGSVVHIRGVTGGASSSPQHLYTHAPGHHGTGWSNGSSSVASPVGGARGWQQMPTYVPTPPSAFRVAVSIVPAEQLVASAGATAGGGGPGSSVGLLARSNTHAAFGSSPSTVIPAPPMLANASFANNMSFANTKSFDDVLLLRHAASTAAAGASSSGVFGGGSASITGNFSRGNLDDAIQGALAGTGGGAGTESVPNSVDCYRVHLLLSSRSASASASASSPVSGVLLDMSMSASAGDGQQQHPQRQVAQVRAKWRQFLQLVQFIDSVAPKFEPPKPPSGFPFPIQRGRSYVKNTSFFTGGADGASSSHAADASPISGTGLSHAGGEHGGVANGSFGATETGAKDDTMIPPSRREARRTFIEDYLNAALAAPSVSCLDELQSFVGYHVFLRNERSQFTAAAVVRQKSATYSDAAKERSTSVPSSAAASVPAHTTSRLSSTGKEASSKEEKRKRGSKRASVGSGDHDSAAAAAAADGAPLFGISLHSLNSTSVSAEFAGSSVAASTTPSGHRHRHRRHRDDNARKQKRSGDGTADGESKDKHLDEDRREKKRRPTTRKHRSHSRASSSSSSSSGGSNGSSSDSGISGSENGNGKHNSAQLHPGSLSGSSSRHLGTEHGSSVASSAKDRHKGPRESVRGSGTDSHASSQASSAVSANVGRGGDKRKSRHDRTSAPEDAPTGKRKTKHHRPATDDQQKSFRDPSHRVASDSSSSTSSSSGSTTDKSSTRSSSSSCSPSEDSANSEKHRRHRGDKRMASSAGGNSSRVSSLASHSTGSRRSRPHHRHRKHRHHHRTREQKETAFGTGAPDGTSGRGGGEALATNRTAAASTRTPDLSPQAPTAAPTTESSPVLRAAAAPSAPPSPSPPPHMAASVPQPPHITEDERVMLEECFRMLDTVGAGTVAVRHTLFFWVCALPSSFAELMRVVQPRFGDEGEGEGMGAATSVTGSSGSGGSGGTTSTEAAAARPLTIGEWGTPSLYHTAMALLPAEVLALPAFEKMDERVNFPTFLAVIQSVLRVLTTVTLAPPPPGTAAATGGGAPTAPTDAAVSVAAWIDAFWVLQYCRLFTAIALLQHGDSTAPLRARLSAIKEETYRAQLARHREANVVTAGGSFGSPPNPLAGLTGAPPALATSSGSGNSGYPPHVSAPEAPPQMSASPLSTNSQTRAGSHFLDETTVLPIVLPAVAEALLSPGNPTINGFDVFELFCFLFILCESGIRLVSVEEVLSWVGLRSYTRDLSFSLEELASLMDSVSKAVPFSELLRCLAAGSRGAPPRAQPTPYGAAGAAAATALTQNNLSAHSAYGQWAQGSGGTLPKTFSVDSLLHLPGLDPVTDAPHHTRVPPQPHPQPQQPQAASLASSSVPFTFPHTAGAARTGNGSLPQWRQEMGRHVRVLRLVSRCALAADPLALAAVQDRVIEHSWRVRGGVCGYCDTTREALRLQGVETERLTQEAHQMAARLASAEAALAERSAAEEALRKELEASQQKTQTLMEFLQGTKKLDAIAMQQTAPAGLDEGTKSTADDTAMSLANPAPLSSAGDAGTNKPPTPNGTSAVTPTSNSSSNPSAPDTRSKAIVMPLTPLQEGVPGKRQVCVAGAFTYDLRRDVSLPDAEYPTVFYLDFYACYRGLNTEDAEVLSMRANHTSSLNAGTLAVHEQQQTRSGRQRRLHALRHNAPLHQRRYDRIRGDGVATDTALVTNATTTSNAPRRERISLRDGQGRCLAIILLDATQGTVTITGAASTRPQTVAVTAGNSVCGDRSILSLGDEVVLAARGDRSTPTSVNGHRHTLRPHSHPHGQPARYTSTGTSGVATALPSQQPAYSLRRRNLLFPSYVSSSDQAVAVDDATLALQQHEELKQRQEQQQRRARADAAASVPDPTFGRCHDTARVAPGQWHRLRIEMNWDEGSFHATVAPLLGNHTTTTASAHDSARHSAVRVLSGPTSLDFVAYMLDGAQEVEGLAMVDAYPRASMLYAYSNACVMYDPT